MNTNKKRLGRDKKNGIISGVCQGIGEYLNLSPWIFRVLFVLPVLPFVLTFFAGVISIGLYILLSVVLKDQAKLPDDNVIEVEYEVVDDPEEPEEEPEKEQEEQASENKQ
ncbi:MAG: PspC domain-containing protein [Eubacterium sp.]